MLLIGQPPRQRPLTVPKSDKIDQIVPGNIISGKIPLLFALLHSGSYVASRCYGEQCSIMLLTGYWRDIRGKGQMSNQVDRVKPPASPLKVTIVAIRVTLRNCHSTLYHDISVLLNPNQSSIGRPRPYYASCQPAFCP